MALYALPRTALAESDADGTNGSNIVANAVITVTDLDGGTVVMYDDADGTGGATSKLTNSKGQKDIYLPSGEYIISINGVNPQRVVVGNPKEMTTTGLINSNRRWQTGDIIETTGFTTAGDGGGASWRKTGNTGTASQLPAQLLDGLIRDARGDEWELVFSESIKLESLGGAGDNSSDNTLPFVAAITAIGEGEGVELSPGGVYLAQNVILQNKTSENVYNFIKCVNGTATIKAASGGNPEALVLDERYITNSAFACNGYRFQNIILDNEDGIKDYAVINRTFQSEMHGCNIVGGYLFTRGSSDGTLVSTYLSNSKWLFCKFYAKTGGTTSTPLLKTEPVADGPTDGYVIGCDFNGRSAADYCIDLGSSGGWIVTNNHSFSGNLGDVYLRDLAGNSPTIANNHFEEEVVIGGTSTNYPFKTGGGNVYWSNVRVDFNSDTTKEVVHIDGDTFGRAIGFGSPARATHNNSGSNKYLVITSCGFEGSVYYNDNFSTGNVRCVDCYSTDTMFTSKTTEVISSDSLSFSEIITDGSASAFGVFYEDRYKAKNDASESVVYAKTQYATGVITDGTEAGQYKVLTKFNGVDVTGFTVYNGGLGIGSNNAQGPNTVNATTYYAAGASGDSGSFTTTDGKTVTVSGGIITAIV